MTGYPGLGNRPAGSRLRVERQEVGDPLGALARWIHERPLFYFEHPASGRAIVGVGLAAAIATAGPERFRQAAGSATELLEALALPEERPYVRLVGGFGFAPAEASAVEWREFPPLSLMLPQQAWVWNEGQCWQVSCEAALELPGQQRSEKERHFLKHSPEPGAGESDAQWLERVERVLADIEQGRLRKLVLSRRRIERLSGTLDILGVLDRLRARRRSCYTFLVAPGETLFLGSTPELLVRKQGLAVETQSLAGTTARCGHDDEAAARLRHSAKDAREQAEVTRGIIEALGPVASRIAIEGSPRVLAVPEAYHLHTPIRAELCRPASVLEVAGLVHPTPAVCGTPRAEAARRLAREEPERGWFSGGVGWMDGCGDGEFAVALRSVLIDGHACTCWAGAGIVAGSCPQAELEETETKMSAVRSVLEECLA